MVALAARLLSADVVLNLLARGRESIPPVPTPASLALGVEPAADRALRRPARSGGDLMEGHTVVGLMVKLKLRGMRTACDEIITLAGKRGHAPERVVGDLLAAQLADVESRATV